MTAIPSPTGLLRAPGQTLVIACIDKFELTASAAAAIHFTSGHNLALVQLHLHFGTYFFLCITNFNMLDEGLLCSLSDPG